MTTTVLIILNVFTALSIIILALMQQSKGDMGAAFGGGGSQSMFGSRGSANFLSRLTSIMCVVFFASSLTLAYIYSHRADNDGVLSNSVIGEVEEVQDAVESEVPSVPGVTTDTETVTETVESAIPDVPESGTLTPAVETEAVDKVEEEVPAVPEQQ